MLSIASLSFTSLFKSERDACPLQNLFSIKITQKLLSVFFASSLTMKRRKPAVLSCIVIGFRLGMLLLASRNLLENNLFFKTLITLEPKVPHSSDASQNDHKSKSYLPVYWCGLRLMRISKYRGMANYNWWMFLSHTWRSPPFRRWSSWSWPPASASSSQSLWTLNWYHLPPDEQPLWIWWEGGQFVIIYLMLLSDTDNLLSVWDNLL